MRDTLMKVASWRKNQIVLTILVTANPNHKILDMDRERVRKEPAVPPWDETDLTPNFSDPCWSRDN